VKHCVVQETIAYFGGATVQSGQMKFPFSLIIPEETPPYYVKYWGLDDELEMMYYLRAEVISVNHDMVISTTGKNKLRADKLPICVVPSQNIAPSEPVYLPFNKKTGLARKRCTGSITVNKSCFLPGEKVDLQISIDNTACEDSCELKIRYVSTAKFRQPNKSNNFEKEISSKAWADEIVKAHQKVENFILVIPLPTSIDSKIMPPTM
jgi:hypothetical protein